MLTFFTFKYDKNNVFLRKEGILAHSMLIFTIRVQKIGYLRTYLTFCPHIRGVRLLGQGVRFFGYFPNTQGVRLLGTGTQNFAKKIARGTFIREGTFIWDLRVSSEGYASSFCSEKSG